MLITNKDISAYAIPGVSRVWNAKAVLTLIVGYYPGVKIFENTRKKEIIEARHMLMYILFEVSKLDYPKIAELTGFDRNTCRWAHTSIKNRLEVDKQFVHKYIWLLKRLELSGYENI
jgi:chromosomal replication initiation ATPase DnaA